MKYIIVGGVAAGASAAARLRRLDESAEIVLLERGPYISYANCGLPYHLGDVISKRDSLLVMPEAKFKAWFNIDIRTKSEAVAIDRNAKTVSVRGADGTTVSESYDKLLIATGSSPIVPAMPGSDDERILPLWTIPNMDSIAAKIKAGAKKAVVVGAGFIGLETAENLAERGLDVTVVELMDQVLPTIDREMATPLAQELSSLGIALKLGRKVLSFEKNGNDLSAVLDNDEKLPADLVVMSIGVKPNSDLAKAAGLELGVRGHIKVDEFMRTSDENIYAAGDAVEVFDPVTGGATAVPLAGPANRQGRIAADNMAGGSSRYPGSLGAAVLKVGSLNAASVGLTERRIRQLDLPYEKIYLHPGSNASYYPGSTRLHIKLIFAPDGKILGAQIVGGKGVDKRIDTISCAMRNRQTAPELGSLELAYAPPFNSAKDPVNFAGFIAENVLNGTSKIVHADELPKDALILDVREPAETELGIIPGSTLIPLGQLRTRLNELDKNREIVVLCQLGLRGYLAERILRQNGFSVRNLSGGYVTWKFFHPAPFVPAERVPDTACCSMTNCKELDVRALACPGPVVRLKNEVNGMAPGETLKLLAPASFSPDLTAWAKASGNEVVHMERKNDYLEAVVRKGTPSASPKTESIPAGEHRAAIVLFSNDLDKAMAALIIACGMAASGAKVGIFFTFWGLSVLRKNPAPPVKKPLISRMFGWMLPKGASKLVLSKMNMGGMGTLMMKQVMARENVLTLPELLEQARQLGVKFVACEMAMDVMGITREELVDIDEVAGVASFVAMAKNSNNTLFI